MHKNSHKNSLYKIFISFPFLTKKHLIFTFFGLFLFFLDKPKESLIIEM